MATYLELKAQAEKLMAQAEEARKKEIAEVVADIKKKMAEYGITASEARRQQRKLGLLPLLWCATRTTMGKRGLVWVVSRNG